MKLTFTFTDTNSQDISLLPRESLYQSHLQLPDTVQQLPTAKEKILAISELVGQLTKASLHLTCKELNLKNYPIKLTTFDKTLATNQLRYAWHNLVIYLESHHMGGKSQVLKIRMPVDPLIHIHPLSKGRKQLHHNLQLPKLDGKTEEQIAYITTITKLAEHCVELLNSDPSSIAPISWSLRGFHPFWPDNTAITTFNNRSKKQEAETKRQEKLVKKQQEQQAKVAQAIAEGKAPHSPPQTGAGRRVGAVPGIFKGVQFRSQLEIRFATELEAKQIRWFYEAERLGDGNYLVDFYLPDLRCWVEVKGRFEPRDHYLLKDVASYLKKERNERLFVYTQNKVFGASSSRFTEMPHPDFWQKVGS